MSHRAATRSTATRSAATRTAAPRLATLHRRLRSDRGDIPGWVLVTVMTAGLVTAVWLIADGQLTAILNRALVSVSSV